MRRKGQDLDLNLDIKPVMNLMVVLIPLLLAGVEYVKLSVIEIDLPPTQAGGGGNTEEKKPEQEKEKRLNLSIAITHDGFTITSASAVLTGETGEGPTIPLSENNDFDYDQLTNKLIEIKKLIENKDFKDRNSAIITASTEIKYQVIIKVLDAIQTTFTDDEGNVKPLFPQVNFGQVIV